MKASMVFFFLILASLMTGCLSSRSYQPFMDYRSQAPKLKRIGVVIAQAEILNLGAGNDTWPDFEKSAQSKIFFESAVVNEFNRKGYAAVLLPIDDDLRALIKQYDNTRPNFQQDRDIYTTPNLQSTVPVLTRADVDAIAIIWALDHISTAGRKALNVTSNIILFILGTGGVVLNGETYCELALLDKSGKLIFFKLKKGKNYNLTEEDSVSRICSELVSDLETIQQ